MTRKQEYIIIYQIILEYFIYIHNGIFNTRNVVGDNMTPMFKGKYFRVDICEHYGYYEIFGCNKKEWKELVDFYNKLESVVFNHDK